MAKVRESDEECPADLDPERFQGKQQEVEVFVQNSEWSAMDSRSSKDSVRSSCIL